ncbi:hypothetical protein [Halolactibacillus sp. JCM 19043]|uniref:hypothetical protein n=1 Tax=Halolactibacillus sp. JCM 19043 TaxID=1460638 RepID=UPI000784A4B8|nr:hypothetical protein [Halolactibacillus sp. JCM 19043]
MKKISIIFLLLVCSFLLVTSPLSASSNLEDSQEQSVELEVKSVKSYYLSPDGTQIEYTDDNMTKITNAKINDFAKISNNTLPFQKSDNKSLPHYTISENIDGNTVEIKREPLINTMSLDPVYEINGRLALGINVFYVREEGDNYEYMYESSATWSPHPLLTLKDSLVTTWDYDAKAKANTFIGSKTNWNTPTDTPIYYDPYVRLDPVPSEFTTYGHGVHANLEPFELQTITTTRNVYVHKNHAGSKGSIIVKYFHSHFPTLSAGISFSLGPGTIEFEPGFLNLGDVTMVEYNYTYGDK